MERFRCPSCSVELFFPDGQCLNCGTAVTLDPVEAVFVRADQVPVCEHRTAIDCNWRAHAGGRCRSCNMSTTIPPRHVADAVAGWRDAEQAKRRLVLQLLSVGLLDERSGPADPQFEMRWSADGSITIGHADGLITVDVGEADDVRRERLRTRLAEPYRTMLGHLRHEVGHFFWPRLAELPGALDRLRDTFGDERADYQWSIDRHYAEGPPDDWQQHHISSYATMHPWEDWAESFAHYLHLRDVLDTGGRLGLVIGAATFGGPAVAIDATTDRRTSFDDLQNQWMAVAVATNALNRSMDQPDLYPFALTPSVVDKIRLVHDLVATQTM